MRQYHKIISIGKILLLIGVYSLFEILGGIWLSGMGGSWEEQPYLADTLSCILMLLFYGFLFYMAHKKECRKESILKANGKTYVAATVMTLGVGSVSFYWFAFVDIALRNIPFIQQSAERFEERGNSVGQEPYLWVFFSVVTLGPIVEELIFRGLIFREAEKIKSGLFPVIVSAILFGLFHMEFVQIVYTMIMGFVLGFIYYMTRSFTLVCYLHILNNLFATPPPVLENEVFVSATTFLQVVMVLPAAYILFRWIRIYRKKTCSFMKVS